MPAQGVYREEICWVLGIYNCGYNTNETLVPYWSHLYFHFWNISWHHLFKLWVFYCCKLVDFWINILHHLQFCPIHWIAHESYRLYKNMVNISRNHWISKFKQEFFYQNRVHQFKYIPVFTNFELLQSIQNKNLKIYKKTILFSSLNTQFYESRIFCLFTFWVFFPDKNFKLI